MNTSSRIVVIAARNIHVGDTYILDFAGRRHEHVITAVERIDYEDRVCVGITYTDYGTIGHVPVKWQLRTHHRIKVRRTGNPSTAVDFTPKTND